MPQKPNTYQQFIQRIDSEGGLKTCWEWMGIKYKPSGYGRFKIKGKEYLAHRIAYSFFWNVDLQHCNVIMHTCDNPSCCNPLHLKNSTQLENMKDKMSKNRFSNGIKTNKNNQPYDSSLIKKMHLDGYTNQQIANALGCHRHTIRNHLSKFGLAMSS